MTKDEQIREAFKALVGVSGAMTFLAEVKAVNETESTITVSLGNDLTLQDIRLRSIVDGDNGFYLIPQIGSQVMLLRLGSSDEFLAVGFSKYDKVIIKGETMSLEVNQDNIIFNASALDSFIPDINKLVTKINNLEQSVNDLKTALKSWVPIPQDGGASLKAGITAWANMTITKTTKDDIKDPKILN
jgi:hypothetical protein